MRRWLAVTMILALLCTSIPIAHADETKTGQPQEVKSEAIDIADAQTYAEFLTTNNIKVDYVPEGTIAPVEIPLSSVSGDTAMADDAITVNEGKTITANFNATPGMYYLYLEYDPLPGRTQDVELQLKLQGEYPFKEAYGVTLPRRWKDKGEKIAEDANGNDIRPSQEEIGFDKRGWLNHKITDSAGFYTSPLLFKLEDTNTFELTVARENVRLHKIIFVKPDEIPSYKEYTSLYKGKPDGTAEYPDIQAEDATWKNNITLAAEADRISPQTFPNKGAKISLNMMGGTNWAAPGTEVAWDFTPQDSGMYEIRMRTRQNYTQGFYSSRKLRINGEVPFKEAEDIHFTYTRDWQMQPISVDGEACKFYFEKGKTYTISLAATLGDLGEILAKTQESVVVLNGVYRDLLMIMGSAPDELRDYYLEKQVPETIKQIGAEAANIRAIAKQVKEVTGKNGSELSALNRIAEQLELFYDKPASIPKKFSSLKDNVASLTDWAMTARSRPLDVDYIDVAIPGSAMPKADANFFERMLYSIKLFFSSFVEDYNSVTTDTSNSETSITVWMTTGRDQANILNQQIQSFYMPFTKERYGKHVGVKLQIVDAGTLLPSVAAGSGADVLLNAAASTAVDYGLRKATKNIYDIAPKEEVDKILERFRPGASDQMRFNGSLYAVPEQETFPLLFYREDILAQLGIKPPTIENPWTWDDVIAYLPILQQKNMSFLMETGANPGGSGLSTYAMLLFQNGGKFYNDNGISSALSDEVAVEAFSFWTSLYTEYGLPTQFNSSNRFRTGESPLVVADLSLYNQLAVSAPEIKGLWNFGPVPGTKRKDGTVDFSVQGSASGVMVLASAKDTDASWDFIKWWTQADTQSHFAREIEGLLGTSARYPSANVEAFHALAWSTDEIANIDNQAKWLKRIPEVPGGYYTPRYINNAFRSTCVDAAAEEPRDSLLYYASVIDGEILSKRTEFKLPTK
ncbi:MAG: extracellular solute-binding protein [Oscillospiraceae bacterium]